MLAGNLTLYLFVTWQQYLMLLMAHSPFSSIFF
jgi:hypothetical protein